MIRFGVVALVAICGVFAAPAPVMAQVPATYQVDPVLGDDSTGTGADTAPFRTIARALAAAQAGETLVLRPGRTTSTSPRCDPASP